MTAIVLDPTIPHEKEFDYSHCPNCGAGADALEWAENDYGDEGYSQHVRCADCTQEFRLWHQSVAVEMRNCETDKLCAPWPKDDTPAGLILSLSVESRRAEYTDTDAVWLTLDRIYRQLTTRNLGIDTTSAKARIDREESGEEDFDYGQITHEQMEHALTEFIGTTNKSSLCAIPGVREIILEEENNTLLDIARQRIEEAS